ncbi:hypothetical protein H0A43_00230 [Arcobacter lanthieri]|nr:hypothetical protein [Aliarcobacter lanthieri]MBL3518899.1 hypothetical protein [Aliarcobacter lanthieri]
MEKGLRLNNVGVSNKDNIVLNYKNRDKEHNLILKPENCNELVVSFIV